jgi:hypothetical protein
MLGITNPLLFLPSAAIAADGREGEYMLRQDLEKIAHASNAERLSIVRVVARSAGEHLEEIISYAIGPAKRLRQPAIEIIRQMGFPDNKDAIRALVANIGDPNSPSWELAGETLLEIEPNIVGMHIIEYMFDCCSHNAWADIDSICMWLASDSVDRVYAVDMGPFIVYALSKDFYRNFPSDNLLAVLEKLGPECTIYALPILLELAYKCKEHHKSLGERVWNFIHLFGEKQLAPYARVISELDEKYHLDS